MERKIYPEYPIRLVLNGLLLYYMKILNKNTLEEREVKDNLRISKNCFS